MKVKHFLSSVLAASMLIATVADAGSIGRSGGSSGGGGRSSFSSSSSSHSSSVSAPSKPSPSVAPAPSKPGGIGGTQSSVGVRKSEVTQPVANKVQDSKSTSTASTGSTSTTSSSSGYSAPPVGSYGYSSPSPVYSQPSPVTNGSTFMSSLGGSLVGNMIGNSLFGHGSHGGGTTVINNGTPSGGTVSSNQMPQTVQSDGSVVSSNFAVQPQQKKEEFTMWSFIWNVITFAILVAVLVGIAWLFYKGFKMIKGYVDKERGVGPNQPFSPTQHFWDIQKAFASADVTALKAMLGPDVVDELTMDLQPSSLTIKNVSHEVRLNTPREFSVWYKFFETDGTEVNQVWHYEKFGTQWQLNGIENV